MIDWFEPYRIVNKLTRENGKLTTIAYLSVITFIAAVVYSLCFPPSRMLSYEVSTDVKGFFLYPSVATPGKQYKMRANWFNQSSNKEYNLSVMFRSFDHYISLKTENGKQANWINIFSRGDTNTYYWPILNAELLPGQAFTKEIHFLMHDPEVERGRGITESILSKLKRYYRRVNIYIEINLDGHVFQKKESIITIWRSFMTNLTRIVLAFLVFTLSVVETSRRIYVDSSR